MKQLTKQKYLLLVLVQLCFLQGFAQLSRGEYFFDADPGVGNGFALPSASITQSGNDLVTFNGNITVPASLAPGNHTVYVRFQKTNGAWSIYAQQRFTISTANGIITDGEYFFDNDPGVGNGTVISLSGNADSSIFNSSISTTGLTPGYHTVYVRAKTASGVWSLYEGKRFRVTPAGSAITQAEYFFDTDPGVGQGTALSITSGNSDSATISGSISSTGLRSGYHNLYVRVKGAAGWSVYEKSRIFVNAALTKAEYFIDNDPGVGAGTLLSLTALGEYTGGIAVSPCLPAGHHLAYVRAMNSDGIWSLYDSVGFNMNPIPVTATIRYPGPGPNGTPLRLVGAGGCSTSYFYKNITAGEPETTNPRFLVSNGSSTQFQIRDNAGNITNLTFNAPADPTDMTTATNTNNSSQSVLLDGWNEWVYVQDASGKIIAAVNDNGRDLGSVTVNDSIYTGGVRQAAVFNGYYLNRNWQINSTNAPASASIGLRLYFSDAEYNALAAADPGVTNTSSLLLLKYNGTNENVTVYDNAANGYVRYSKTTVPFTGASVNGYAMETTVPAFGEFYITPSANITLPLQLVTFNAQLVGSNARLTWTVADVRNVRGFEVEKSTDALHFTDQGFVSISAASSYSFTDVLTANNRYYYRLRIIDNDGRITYSTVRIVSLSSKPDITVYPNPVTSELHVAAGRVNFTYHLTDMHNRVLVSGQSASALDLDMRSFAKGVYLLQLSYDGIIHVEKIVKE